LHEHGSPLVRLQLGIPHVSSLAEASPIERAAERSVMEMVEKRMLLVERGFAFVGLRIDDEKVRKRMRAGCAEERCFILLKKMLEEESRQINVGIS
jgi:hypothetical protein